MNVEIRYNKTTGEVTGISRGGRSLARKHPDEVCIIHDIPAPAMPPEAWLYDTDKQGLKPKPGYATPRPQSVTAINL